MSNVVEFVKESLANISVVLEKYENALTGFEQNLDIKGKNIERANVEHASWMSYYDERRIELNSLLKYMDSRVEQARGKLWQAYTENYSRELSQKDKEMYIKNEPAYLNMYELYLEVEELYKKYESVVEAFKARGYALNNIVKLRVASMEDSTA